MLLTALLVGRFMLRGRKLYSYNTNRRLWSTASKLTKLTNNQQKVFDNPQQNL